MIKKIKIKITLRKSLKHPKKNAAIKNKTKHDKSKSEKLYKMCQKINRIIKNENNKNKSNLKILKKYGTNI